MNKDDLLHKYFLNELNTEEKIELETLLINDADFKAQFDFENDVQHAVKNTEKSNLKKKLLDFENEIKNQEKKNTFNWKRLAMAASVLLLIGFGGYNYYTSTPDYLFNTYYQIPDYTTAMGNNNSCETDWNLPKTAYENANYQKAIDLYNSSKTCDNYPDFVDYYLAQSYLAVDNTSQAIIHYKKLIDKNSTRYIDQARWYLGLCYLKEGQKENALDVFRELQVNPNTPNYKKPQLKKIVSTLE